MRKIKFRAWDKKTKKMRVVGSIAFGVLSANKEGYPVCSLLGFDCIEQKEYFIHRDSPDFILEQFTGLHDKNGKEIYEGDVVRYESDEENAIAIVSSYYGNNLYFCWQNIPDSPTNTDIFGCKEELEVIGNIHENPELLNAR